MTTTKKVILAGTCVLLVSAVVYIFSQDAKRKKYIQTSVPPDYALKLINK